MKTITMLFFSLAMFFGVYLATGSAAETVEKDFSLTQWISANAELVVIPLFYAVINFVFSLYVNISDTPSENAPKWKKLAYSFVEVVFANMWGKAKQTGDAQK